MVLNDYDYSSKLVSKLTECLDHLIKKRFYHMNTSYRVELLMELYSLAYNVSLDKKEDGRTLLLRSIRSSFCNCAKYIRISILEQFLMNMQDKKCLCNNGDVCLKQHVPMKCLLNALPSHLREENLYAQLRPKSFVNWLPKFL